jgi:carbamoyltransferase
LKTDASVRIYGTVKNISQRNGKPTHVEAFREIISLKSDGRYEIADTDLSQLLGPVRLGHEPFGGDHFNIAYLLQMVLHESVLELAQWLKQATASETLCFAGGVALNCVLNNAIREAGILSSPQL